MRGLLALGWATIMMLLCPGLVFASDVLNREVQAAIADFRERDPSMDKFFEGSVGYAVFPSIAKAGFIIGGAYGKGQLFRAEQYIGDASVTQGTIGLQVGGATYREIIFFKEEWRLKQFMSGNFTFSASVSAVAVTAGAAKSARYNNGVAVFTLAKGGLMLEAAVGGQKFGFKEAKKEPAVAKTERVEPVAPLAEE